MLFSWVSKVVEEKRMLTRAQIIDEVDAVVAKYGSGRYRMWFVGVASDLDGMRQNRSFEDWYFWEAETEALAIEIKNFFVEKGMASDYAQNLSGRYVYIF